MPSHVATRHCGHALFHSQALQSGSQVDQRQNGNLVVPQAQIEMSD